MTRRLIIVIAGLALIAALGFAPSSAQDAPDEVPVTFIELSGPAAERDAEISSLAWYGDYLLLVTENPFLYKDGEASGMFFALEKGDILDYLDGDNAEPLEPFPVPILGPDIEDAVGGFEVAFDGFEAAYFVDDPNFFAHDRIFLTIEADTVAEDDPTMRGYIVWGEVEPELSAIRLELDAYIALPPQTEFNNMAYESLLVHDNQLIVLYEANGAEANPDAVGYTVDLETGALGEIAIEHIEFRVTDATDVDANGVFWVPNYFFPGETFLASDDDPIFAQYGMGASQAEFGGYERLIALQITDNGIEVVDQAPIQLLQTPESNGRNWEGIVRLDDRGFLIATDRFPQTLLGFVPLPESGM